MKFIYLLLFLIFVSVIVPVVIHAQSCSSDTDCTGTDYCSVATSQCVATPTDDEILAIYSIGSLLFFLALIWITILFK